MVKERVPKASDALFEAVCGSFAAPHFTTLSEVRDSTGFDSGRSADALALGMYSSRGRELWGFEFKVSRSDWLCELRKPEKAESWFQYCDRWGLVVSSAEIVKVEELPVGWGLGVPSKNGQRVKWLVQPPKLEPRLIDRHALCAFVYRALQAVQRDRTAFEWEIRDEMTKIAEKNAETKQKELLDLRAGLRAFLDATGLRYTLSFSDEEGAKKIGAAIREFRDSRDRTANVVRQLNREAEFFEDEARIRRERSETLIAALMALDAGQTDAPIVPDEEMTAEYLMGTR